MAQTKLIYFNVTALGEPIRFLLSYGDIKFEDERLESSEVAARKTTFPFGKLPVLEIDGKTLHQSSVILRYLAAKMGLTGADAWQAIECDMIADTITDFRSALASFHYENNEEVKIEKRKNTLDNVVPLYLTRLDALVTKNGGFLVGNQLTWPDFLLAGLSEYIEHIVGSDLLGTRPALKELREKVLALPAIKKYLENRPKTPY